MRVKKIVRCLLVVAGLAVLTVLIFSEKEVEVKYSPRDYAEIISSGTLRAVTVYNAVSMHVEGDSLGGFDYELLHAFAQDKGLQLEMTPVANFEERFQGITEGRYDLLAAPTVITAQLRDTLNFTHSLLLTKQVLVQRKKEKGKDSLFIASSLDLANKDIHLTKGSPAIVRMHNLMTEIGDTIFIHEIERYGSEQLLAMVAGGDIDYAVCEENIAQASIKDFPNLDIKTDISFNQFYSWGVNQHATVLLDTLNRWLDEYMATKAYHTLCKKYFD